MVAVGRERKAAHFIRQDEQNGVSGAVTEIVTTRFAIATFSVPRCVCPFRAGRLRIACGSTCALNRNSVED
jgi:hypothetical protein